MTLVALDLLLDAFEPDDASPDALALAAAADAARSFPDDLVGRAWQATARACAGVALLPADARTLASACRDAAAGEARLRAACEARAAACRDDEARSLMAIASALAAAAAAKAAATAPGASGAVARARPALAGTDAGVTIAERVRAKELLASATEV